MGANCCVAAKDKPRTSGTQLETLANRNARHSPSWSFRWDHRTHIEDIMDNPPHFSSHSSGDIQPEVKGRVPIISEHLSDVGSPSDAFQTIKPQKLCRKAETNGLFKTRIADQSVESNSSSEVKDVAKPSIIVGAVSDVQPLTPVPSTPTTLSFKPDPSSSRSHSLPANPDILRKARRSPGFQLARQVSDSRAPSLKSLNESSSPEGRLSAAGSHSGSSDGWSMRTFSELVASSQRERWSLDSETISSIDGKAARSNAQQPAQLSPGRQICKVCLKQLKERSLVATNELSAVAVLFCGHVYHADCLDKVTPDADKFDPPCPLCVHGEKQMAKMFGKFDTKVRGWISPIAVVDIDGDSSFQHQKRGKGPKMRVSSSMKSSFGRPFLRQHFSMGLRPSRSLLEGESIRKKGFWARYFKADSLPK